jgi:hypothetical protein
VEGVSRVQQEEIEHYHKIAQIRDIMRPFQAGWNIQVTCCAINTTYSFYLRSGMVLIEAMGTGRIDIGSDSGFFRLLRIQKQEKECGKTFELSKI